MAVDGDECLLSYQGDPICDDCFQRQMRPLPSPSPSGEVALFEPPSRRRALLLHASGLRGWLAVAFTVVAGGVTAVGQVSVAVVSLFVAAGFGFLAGRRVAVVFGG